MSTVEKLVDTEYQELVRNVRDGDQYQWFRRRIPGLSPSVPTPYEVESGRAG